MNQHTEIKKQITEFSHRLYQRGLVAANDGNISALTDDNDYWFTPSGICKGDLTEQDLVRINSQGTIIDGHRKLTSEYMMHLAIYEVRPDIRAVVHAHSVFSTAFATARIPMDHCILPEIITTIGSVPLADYATPSTEGLAHTVQDKMRDYDVCLMANHGIVAAGRSVAEAYFNIERVEHFAKILFYARLLGGEKHLDPNAVSRLKNIYDSRSGNAPPLPSCRTTENADNIKNRIACKACADNDLINKTSNDTISALIRDVIINFQSKQEM